MDRRVSLFLYFLSGLFWAAIFIPKTNIVESPRQVSQRPVVMVHGFISNYQTWNSYLGPDGFLASVGLQGFAAGDGQVPGKMNTGSITDPALRTNTIAENAEILGEYIQGVKQLTGASQVDLLAHSMGGMISRYYIDTVMDERDVAQLVMLGSPMLGSDCATLPASLELYLPATIEIRPSYMRDIFNKQVTDRKGVPFYALAGTVITEQFRSPCTNIPSDLVVSKDSVQGIQVHLTELSTLHSEMTTSREIFDSFVQPLLVRSTEVIPEEENPVSESPAVEPLDFTRVYTGHVTLEDTEVIELNIEQGVRVASFAMFDPTRTITATVQGASGNVIPLSEEANGLVIVDDPSTLLYLGYGFNDPRPGTWRVIVSAGQDTPPTGADFALTAHFSGGASLLSGINPVVPESGEQVIIEASLVLGNERLPVETAEAVVSNSRGETQSIPLTLGENGYRGEFSPEEEGIYSIDVVLTGFAPDGTTVTRGDYLSILVQPETTPIRQYLTTAGLIGLILGTIGLSGILLVRAVSRAVGRKNRA